MKINNKIFKNFFILLFLITFSFFSQINIAKALGFIPNSGDGINTFGIGIYFAPQNIKIYSDYDSYEESNQILEAKWDFFNFDCQPDEHYSRNMFIAYKPEKKQALMIVTDEKEDALEVIYNLQSGARGWLKKSSGGEFYTWKNFIEEYGKKNGVYIFSGTPANLKKVRTAPSDNAQLLKNNYYWAKNINLVYIRGNWMLVKILDFNRETPVGWIKWRDDNGRIYVFPQLNQQQ